ncbi:TetR family transcriptional regulator [Agrobacterium vitis]|nr:TetR family transcriptional regulator [Agrobacterium vitis]
MFECRRIDLLPFRLDKLCVKHGNVVVSSRRSGNAFVSVCQVESVRRPMSEQQRVVMRLPVMPDEERRERILKAAEVVFDAMGFGDATMEEVARLAGMAKKTVYRFFPDKRCLFTALIQSHDQLQIEIGGQRGQTADPRERVRLALEALARFVLSPRQILVTRLIIAEAGKHPDLTRQFYEDCVENFRAFLAQELDFHVAVSPSEGVDRRDIADIFVGAVLGPLQTKVLMFGKQGEDLDSEIRMRVDLALRLLMPS